MKKVFSIILAFTFIFWVFFNSLEMSSYDKGFFKRYQLNNRVDRIAGVSQDELNKISSDLVDYLKKGDNKLLEKHFNQREIAHMEDVFNLYDKGRFLRNVLFVVMIVSLVTLIKKTNLNEFLSLFSKSILLVEAFIAIVLAFIMRDFSSSFIKFHHIFFDNDLWQLNPETDLMIRMLPEDFFKTIVTKTILAFVFTVIFVQLGMYFYLRYRQRRNDKCSR